MIHHTIKLFSFGVDDYQLPKHPVMLRVDPDSADVLGSSEKLVAIGYGMNSREAATPVKTTP